MSPLAERALARAVGVVILPQEQRQENPKGSNYGHPVQDFLAAVDIFIPASWCMAFVYWCFKDAAGQLGLENPLFKTGGVLAEWHNRVKNQIQLKGPGSPQAGDIMIMDHGHGVGHTGIIESIDTAGTLHTIEGNTNDTGSREGYEVIRKLRIPQAPIIGYLRF